MQRTFYRLDRVVVTALHALLVEAVMSVLNCLV